MLFLCLIVAVCLIFFFFWTLGMFSYVVNVEYSMFGVSEVWFNFMFDNISLICGSMLFLCSLIAIFFYWHYFSWHSDYLIFTIQLFILSMFFLIFTYSEINSFIGWEYLGLVSFFLILYYSIYCSSRAAFITILTSRLGDLGFFLFIGALYLDIFLGHSYLVIILFSLLLMSKSAMFPLSSWLLEAMRAPTPVSSLVHSSTLVAAGVWLFCRYNDIFMFAGSSEIIFYVSMITVIFSGLNAYLYADTKKIIALSTCNNISWCFIYIYFGYCFLGLAQLFCHGIFKCSLFCLIGDFLLNSGGSQNKMYHFYGGSDGHMYLIMLISLFICGFPFLGVFFTKHIFMSISLGSLNIFIYILLFFGVLCSFLYSFRLIFILSNTLSGSSAGFNASFYVVILFFPVFFLVNYWISGHMLEESIGSILFLLTFYLFMSCISAFGWYMNFYNTSGWSIGLFGQDYLLFSSIGGYKLFSSLFYYLSIFRWEQSVICFFSSISSLLRCYSGSVNLAIFMCCFLFYFVFMFIF
uniref:NADH:ubiquinone reductase (H(+)-translocating) n=1 Tax=Macrogyrodactylus karibae TaxID=696689 RepID=A0A2Z4GPM9_9PLAT|nr:NADH dehydrogenase subunit 5 [Macrogyrodactylus karibae]